MHYRYYGSASHRLADYKAIVKRNAAKNPSRFNPSKKWRTEPVYEQLTEQQIIDGVRPEIIGTRKVSYMEPPMASSLRWQRQRWVGEPW